MKRFIGVKQINAKPMNRADYNALRGWPMPDDENPDDEGFLVEYLDGGKANHKDFSGYISWSPEDVFRRAYRPCDGLTFGLAIEAMKAGQRVARSGWNGKGMWLGLVLSYDYNPDKGKATAYALGCQKLPWIGMKTADNCFVPWLASQTDMLADDWEVFGC